MGGSNAALFFAALDTRYPLDQSTQWALTVIKLFARMCPSLRGSEEGAMKSMKYLLVAAMVIGLATPGMAEDAAQIAGKAFFESKCQTCHNPEADRKTYGPSLVGIVGREAGSIVDYPYSDALKNSGITWTEASLKAWIADNDGMMPGTRMRHVGVTDAAEQEMIIAYLKSLSQE